MDSYVPKYKKYFINQYNFKISYIYIEINFRFYFYYFYFYILLMKYIRQLQNVIYLLYV